MDHGTPFAYLYDGSYAGFLTCIYESYVRKELPVSFSTPEDPRISLYPERAGGDGAGLPQAMAAVLRYHLHRGTLSSQVPYDPYAQTLLEHHDRVPD